MRRLSIGALCALAAFSLALWALRAQLDRAAIETPALRVDHLGEFEQTLARFRSRSPSPPRYDVLLFGDSTMFSPEDGGAFERAFGDALEGLGARASTHRLAAPGLGPFAFAFAASAVSDAADPAEAAVIAFNPNSLSESWARNFSAPALAALVPASDLVAVARLPIAWVGLSVDQLATQWLALRTVGFERWHAMRALQARTRDARREIERAAGADELSLRLRTNAARLAADAAPGRRDRASREGLEHRYAGALASPGPDHPVFAALRYATATLRRAGTEVWVYAVPLNVEHMAEVGLSNPPALLRTLDLAAEAVEGEGAHFLDLHASMPDSQFRDAGDHLRFGGPDSAMARTARRVAESLHRADGTGTSSTPGGVP